MKTILLSLGIIFAATPAFADGIELPRTIKPNVSGEYTLRPVISTTNNASGLKFTLHKFDNKLIAQEEYPSFFRPANINTTAGEKRSVFLSFKGPFDKKQDMALCMFTDPNRPANLKRSTMVVNFRYCKIFSVEP